MASSQSSLNPDDLIIWGGKYIRNINRFSKRNKNRNHIGATIGDQIGELFMQTITPISPEKAETLSGLFEQRCFSTPDKPAYRYFDRQLQSWCRYTWKESQHEVGRWQGILQDCHLQSGDRIGIMLNNCPEWVFMEQAALALGMVIVPMYTNDRPANVAYILEDSNVKVLLVSDPQQLSALNEIDSTLNKLNAILVLNGDNIKSSLTNIRWVEMLNFTHTAYKNTQLDADSLATVVYTSGTTGRPKGVMLSHKNILHNTWAAVSAVPCHNNDCFLSFLPLSHMFERTAGYYIPMMGGAEIAYARSIDELGEDLITVKPTVLVTVPRIFERVYEKISIQLQQKSAFARFLFTQTVEIGWKRFEYQQKRRPWSPDMLFWPILNQLVAKKVMAKLGGQMRLAISGGAPLSNEIAKFFIGLGLTITQGYGLTECSPVISTNQLDNNDPFSVGQILPGIQAKTSPEGELMVRSDCIMMGYLNHPDATAAMIDNEGWLHTGDKAEIVNEHLYITGRLKEILVLSNGEKVPPTELEMAICNDPLFEQALVVGEAQPFLSAIVVLNQQEWPKLAEHFSIDGSINQGIKNQRVKTYVIERIKKLLKSFPGYEQIRKVQLEINPWTIDNGLLTPTMKLRRNKLVKHFDHNIHDFYV